MRKTKISVSPVAVLLLASGVSLAQDAKNAPAVTTGWKAMIPKIEVSLREQLKLCIDERRWIDVVQTADVTGDGVPEALVEYCHMGAYTSEATVLQLKNGKPVPARFRDENGKSTEPTFLRGASVRNGRTLHCYRTTEPSMRSTGTQTIRERWKHAASMLTLGMRRPEPSMQVGNLAIN